MREYVDAEGTREAVTEAMMQTFSLDREASEQCLDFIQNHTELLSEDEFFQYSRLEEYEISGVSEFVSEEGEYYISIKKGTIFLLGLYFRNKIPFFRDMKDLAAFFGIGNLKGSYAKLDAREGHLCVMLELARNRRQGIDKNLFRKWKGECCNNQLDCKYKEAGRCRCGVEDVNEICEQLWKSGIVEKKGSRYYYRI